MLIIHSNILKLPRTYYSVVNNGCFIMYLEHKTK